MLEIISRDTNLEAIGYLHFHQLPMSFSGETQVECDENGNPEIYEVPMKYLMPGDKHPKAVTISVGVHMMPAKNKKEKATVALHGCFPWQHGTNNGLVAGPIREVLASDMEAMPISIVKSYCLDFLDSLFISLSGDASREKAKEGDVVKAMKKALKKGTKKAAKKKKSKGKKSKLKKA